VSNAAVHASALRRFVAADAMCFCAEKWLCTRDNHVLDTRLTEELSQVAFVHRLSLRLQELWLLLFLNVSAQMFGLTLKMPPV
jgi:hypothetical protein